MANFQLIDRNGKILSEKDYIPTYWYQYVRDYNYEIKPIY